MNPVGTEGLPLFAAPPPRPAPLPQARASDPVTSHDAVAAAREQALLDNQMILAALARLPGKRGTYFEIAAEAGITPPVRVHRRLGHQGGLVGAGLVQWTQERRALPTGRFGHVYALVER